MKQIKKRPIIEVCFSFADINLLIINTPRKNPGDIYSKRLIVLYKEKGVLSVYRQSMHYT